MNSKKGKIFMCVAGEDTGCQEVFEREDLNPHPVSCEIARTCARDQIVYAPGILHFSISTLLQLLFGICAHICVF